MEMTEIGESRPFRLELLLREGYQTKFQDLILIHGPSLDRFGEVTLNWDTFEYEYNVPVGYLVNFTIERRG